MEHSSSSAHGRLALVGTFGDVSPHHHPAVQVSLGLGADMHLHTADGQRLSGPLVVIASGAEHALHTGDSPVVTSYLRPDGEPAVHLNAMCRERGGGTGVWVPDTASEFVESCRETLCSVGLDAVVEQILAELTTRTDNRGLPAHPQLRRAVDLLHTHGPTDLVSLARSVALSPDYLGRLFARQTGVSYAATARWARLLMAFGHLTRGMSVTDAAHLAGFTDGAHATRVCRELTGAAPRDVLRELRR